MNDVRWQILDYCDFLDFETEAKLLRCFASARNKSNKLASQHLI